MCEDPDETTRRLRSEGYLAQCYEHGNQVFVWNEATEHAHCPHQECKAEVCDFRICFKTGPGHNSAGMVFWHSGSWRE